MRRRYAIAMLAMLAACEDTRRASDRDRDRDRDRESFRDRDRDPTVQKLDDLQAKLDDLQAKLAIPTTAAPVVGAYECDELIRLTYCMYDKTPQMPPDAKKAFEDAVKYWKDALDSPSTRQATIDACKMALDAGRQGYGAVGCY